MNRYQTSASLICVFLFAALLPVNSYAQYKDFERVETKKEFFSILFDKNSITVTATVDSQLKTATTGLGDVQVQANEVKITDKARFLTNALEFENTTFDYSEIVESRVISEGEQTTVLFYKAAKPSSRLSKMREGNVVTFKDSINVKSNDFVKGMALSIAGPITVDGEINKDVISLFGNVSLSSTAVARGDIVSITGEINVETQATIYGEIYSGVKDYDSNRFRFYQESELSAGLMLNYNRVDGLLLGGTLGFTHIDSAFPTIKIGVGYALESARLRFFLRATQLISRNKSFKIGGEYYKKLASEDDRLIGNGENMAFALIAAEDYKNYYETEGGTGWLELHPCQYSTYKIGYRYDDTRWLPAHRNLWSLFGGSKLFPENFSTVESTYRNFGVFETDNTVNATIYLEAEFDDRVSALDENISGWGLYGKFEWSNPDFSSDFDYRRYLISVARYQSINKYTSIRVHAEYAGSDGYLPMYKRFFLGGLGTLWGYKHKEFSGSRYWLANTEYWVNLPTNFESNLFLFWDVGRISNTAGFEDTDEVRNDIGAGLNLADIRFYLAKRLDSAPEKDPKFYLRFSRSF